MRVLRLASVVLFACASLSGCKVNPQGSRTLDDPAKPGSGPKELTPEERAALLDERPWEILHIGTEAEKNAYLKEVSDFMIKKHSNWPEIKGFMGDILQMYADPMSYVSTNGGKNPKFRIYLSPPAGGKTTLFYDLRVKLGLGQRSHLYRMQPGDTHLDAGKMREFAVTDDIVEKAKRGEVELTRYISLIGYDELSNVVAAGGEGEELKEPNYAEFAEADRARMRSEFEYKKQQLEQKRARESRQTGEQTKTFWEGFATGKLPSEKSRSMDEYLKEFRETKATMSEIQDQIYEKQYDVEAATAELKAARDSFGPPPAPVPSADGKPAQPPPVNPVEAMISKKIEKLSKEIEQLSARKDAEITSAAELLSDLHTDFPEVVEPMRESYMVTMEKDAAAAGERPLREFQTSFKGASPGYQLTRMFKSNPFSFFETMESRATFAKGENTHHTGLEIHFGFANVPEVEAKAVQRAGAAASDPEVLAAYQKEEAKPEVIDKFLEKRFGKWENWQAFLSRLGGRPPYVGALGEQAWRTKLTMDMDLANDLFQRQFRARQREHKDLKLGNVKYEFDASMIDALYRYAVDAQSGFRVSTHSLPEMLGVFQVNLFDKIDRDIGTLEEFAKLKAAGLATPEAEGRLPTLPEKVVVKFNPKTSTIEGHWGGGGGEAKVKFALNLPDRVLDKSTAPDVITEERQALKLVGSALEGVFGYGTVPDKIELKYGRERVGVASTQLYPDTRVNIFEYERAVIMRTLAGALAEVRYTGKTSGESHVDILQARQGLAALKTDLENEAKRLNFTIKDLLKVNGLEGIDIFDALATGDADHAFEVARDEIFKRLDTYKFIVHVAADELVRKGELNAQDMRELMSSHSRFKRLWSKLRGRPALPRELLYTMTEATPGGFMSPRCWDLADRLRWLNRGILGRGVLRLPKNFRQTFSRL
jgi:hypothetical protein